MPTRSRRPTAAGASARSRKRAPPMRAAACGTGRARFERHSGRSSYDGRQAAAGRAQGRQGGMRAVGRRATRIRTPPAIQSAGWHGGPGPAARPPLAVPASARRPLRPRPSARLFRSGTAGKAQGHAARHGRGGRGGGAKPHGYFRAGCAAVLATRAAAPSRPCRRCRLVRSAHGRHRPSLTGIRSLVCQQGRIEALCRFSSKFDNFWIV